MKFYDPTIILSNEKLSNCQQHFSSSVCTVVINEALHLLLQAMRESEKVESA